LPQLVRGGPVVAPRRHPLFFQRRSKMKKNLLRNRLTLAVGLVAVVLGGAVAYASTATILGEGTTPYSKVIGGPAKLTARRLIIPVNDPPSSWHYHPGTLLSVVGTAANRGSVTIEDGCGGSETFAPGQAFENVGGRVHRAVNYSGETVEEHNMFINPLGTPLTVNLPDRQCGPARSVEECKDEGWANFTYPVSFSNQGECVQFVLNGK
jgi:hypothetical protein